MLCLRVLVCLASLCVAYAAVALQASDPKPAKYAQLVGCYMADKDKLLGFGEEYTPIDGTCLRYICFDDEYIQVASCGALAIPNGCEAASGDLSLPYPKCCGGFKCKQSDGSYKSHFPSNN